MLSAALMGVAHERAVARGCAHHAAALVHPDLGARRHVPHAEAAVRLGHREVCALWVPREAARVGAHVDGVRHARLVVDVHVHHRQAGVVARRRKAVASGAERERTHGELERGRDVDELHGLVRLVQLHPPAFSPLCGPSSRTPDSAQVGSDMPEAACAAASPSDVQE